MLNFYLDNSDINDDVREKVSHFRKIKNTHGMAHKTSRNLA